MHWRCGRCTAAANGAAAEREMPVSGEQAAPWGLLIAELFCVLSEFQVLAFKHTSVEHILVTRRSSRSVK